MSTISTFGTCQICGLIQPKQGQCRDCNGIVKSGRIAEPVPPAGGELEVFEPHGWAQTDGPRINAFTREFDIAEEWAMAGYGTVELLNREHVDDEIDRLRGEHQAHITRLQAEVERLKQAGDVMAGAVAALDKRNAEVLALQSELTRARELLSIGKGYLLADGHATISTQIGYFLSNQSAPADKGQDYPEGKRERFQKWVLATKHPVLGFLDGHWLARGDDREGYASEYVQGLWVAYKAFSPEQPAPVAGLRSALAECIRQRDALKAAPVAVSLPERKTVKAGLLSESNTHNQGWNACLDELARLNPTKQ